MKNPSVCDARKKTQHVEEELILRMNGNFMFLLNPHWKRCVLGLLCLLFLVSWGYAENMLLYIQVNRNSSLLNWGQLHLWESELMRTRKGVQKELGDFLGPIHVLFYNEKAKWKLTCFSGNCIENKKEIMLFKLWGGIKTLIFLSVMSLEIRSTVLSQRWHIFFALPELGDVSMENTGWSLWDLEKAAWVLLAP